jgi:hypothetical protein
MLKHSAKHRQSQRTHQSSSTTWWVTYLQANPLQSAFAVTCTFGGVLLLLFFAQLHAMPDLDLAGASSLLLAVALVGLAFTFFLTVCAFGGGLVLQSYGAEAAALRTGYGALLLHMPVILTCLVCGLVLYFYSFEFLPVNWIILFSIGLGTAFYSWWMPDALDRSPKSRAIYAFAYAWLSLIWVTITSLAFLSFWALSAENIDGNCQQLMRLLSWIFLCIILNFALAQLQHISLGVVLAASTLSAMALFLLSGNGMTVPKAVVRSLGLGEMPVALVVTEAGCQQLNQASGIRVCEVRPNEKSALVCPVLLRSRIGSPYFIGFSPLSPQGAWPANTLPTRTAAVAIPKTEVLSWSLIDTKRAEKQTTQQVASTNGDEQGDASQVVTRWNSTAQGDWLARQCGLPN